MRSMNQLDPPSLASRDRAFSVRFPSFCRAAVSLKISLKLGPFSSKNPNKRLEARVGIDRVSPSTSNSKLIVYGIADYLTVNELR